MTNQGQEMAMDLMLSRLVDAHEEFVREILAKHRKELIAEYRRVLEGEMPAYLMTRDLLSK